MMGKTASPDYLDCPVSPIPQSILYLSVVGGTPTGRLWCLTLESLLEMLLRGVNTWYRVKIGEYRNSSPDRADPSVT